MQPIWKRHHAETKSACGRSCSVGVGGRGSDERNLLIFRRDNAGRIVEVIERRKFNDLVLTRGKTAG